MEKAFNVVEEKQGLEFDYSFYEELAPGLGRHIYTEVEKKALLRVVDDYNTPVRYLIVEAMTPEEVAQIGSCLAENLPVIPLTELQDEARLKMLDEPQVLVRMALGTDEISDPISLKILRGGLSSADEQVRFAAATAASLTQWPQFIPDLELLSQNDPVAEVRGIAHKALEACKGKPESKDTSEEENQGES